MITGALEKSDMGGEGLESGGSRWRRVFEDARFEPRAESSEGVPAWPFHGRASRHNEQQGKRMLVLEGQPGAQRGSEVRGLVRVLWSWVRNLNFTPSERGR